MYDLNTVETRSYRRINFQRINAAALAVLPSILGRWLPGGKTEGNEYVARNPRRADKNLGSFKINLRTGHWCDFATGERGGDVISLAAYLANTSQIDAAKKVAAMLGMEADHA